MLSSVIYPESLNEKPWEAMEGGNEKQCWSVMRSNAFVIFCRNHSMVTMESNAGSNERPCCGSMRAMLSTFQAQISQWGAMKYNADNTFLTFRRESLHGEPWRAMLGAMRGVALSGVHPPVQASLDCRCRDVDTVDEGTGFSSGPCSRRSLFL